ncbi:MAG: phosphatase PAP2 family protein [Flavobacteriaceae bacterium]|nr:phosphatase PAP2 family protein [Flavobacteriaceae bacterium]
MLEQLLSLDKKIFVFLNGLGSAQYDALWLFITKQLHWTPFFILVLYFVQKQIGWKKLGIVVLFIAALIAFTDQITNVFKFTFERLRPCKDLEISSIIRIVKCSNTYSFFSGHASNSMATMTFIFLLMKQNGKNLYWLYIFPLVFAYSRIYLGLHFPSDILTGYFFGILSGTLFFKIYQILSKKYNW